MSNAIPYIIQGDNIVLVVDNVSHTISRNSHMNYGRIHEAIRDQDWDTVKSLIDVTESITNYVNGKLEIKAGELFWNGRVFHNALSKRVIQMYEQGFPVDSMVTFMENLLENPSYRAVEGLYGFLEENNLPITDDGCFLAYKRVKKVDGKLVDCYTGKFSNEVGDTVTMDRNEVNDNPADTCSKGLHFCALSYLSSSGYGGSDKPIMIVKVNPADVVAIPNDYNKQKGRCCKYEVMSFHGKDAEEEAFSEPVVSLEKENIVDMLGQDNYHDDDDGDNDGDSGYGGMFRPV